MRGLLRPLAAAVVVVAACAAPEPTIAPADLDLRELLGVRADVARAWSDGERADARAILTDALGRADLDLARPRRPLGPRDLTAAVDELDRARAAAGHDARALVISDVRVHDVHGPALTSWLTGAAPRSLSAALATDAALALAPEVVEVEQLPVAVAVWRDREPPLALVNSVVLAVAAPEVAMAGRESGGPTARVDGVPSSSQVGDAPVAATRIAPPVTINPWSFPDSLDACAASLRDDCARCGGGGTCESIYPGEDPATSCARLDATASGYELACINLALVLPSITACVAANAPSCAVTAGAAEAPALLEANRVFLDDAVCGAALADCLAERFGDGGGCGEPSCGDNACGDNACGDGCSCSGDGCSCSGDGCQSNNDGCKSSNNNRCSVGATRGGGGAGPLILLLPGLALVRLLRRRRSS